MQASRVLDLSKFCLALTLACLPFFLYRAAQLRVGSSQVAQWLPSSDAAHGSYQEFLNRFGHDEFLLVSWPGCVLDDDRLGRVLSKLRECSKERPDLPVEGIEDSASLIARLANQGTGITKTEAARRLVGSAIGEDGTCFVIIHITSGSGSQLGALIHFVRQVASEAAGIPMSELILAGEPYQIFLIDQASREAVRYFVLPSALAALLFAWSCLREVRVTILVLGFAGIGQLLGLAIIAYFVEEMSTVLIVMPTLVFMLTLSAAVHLVSYYRDVGGARSRLSGVRALALGARPCMLAALTTAFGFGSLAVSDLTPVWRFGALSTLGLIMSSAVLLSGFPAACLIGVRFAPQKKSEVPLSGVFACVRSTKRWPAGLWCERWLTRLTRRNATVISILGLALLAVSSAGLVRLQSSTAFEDMFPSGSEAVRSLRWVEEHLGTFQTLELLVTIPSQTPVGSTGLLNRLKLLELTRDHLVLVPSVHGVVSALTYLPQIPRESGTRSTIQRAVLKRKIEANLGRLDEQGWLAVTTEAETWRLTARVRSLTGPSFPRFLAELEAGAARAQAEYAQDNPPLPASLEITGYQVLAEKARGALLTDLALSFATAFLLITPVMMLVARGIFSGLVLMIPSVLPVVLVFGCMGWLEFRLDVAGILTASVALGIAVDDTLHFVSWFMRVRRSGASPQRSVRVAVGMCARPMLMTTCICTGAMLPFFFSDFLPTSKFALLMIMILLGALVGDLVLLPAILQTPIGRFVGSVGQRSFSVAR